MKKETLEEAVELFFRKKDSKNCTLYKAAKFSDKWQQEEDKGKFNKEDLRESYRCGKIYDMTSFDDWFEQLTKVKQTSS